MKGVSAVIAIILILMIVVALAALAWTWFSGIFADLTESAGESITQQQEQIQKNFALEASFCAVNGSIGFSVRNIGTGELDGDQVSAYVNNVPASTTGVGGILAEGAISSYMTENVTCFAMTNPTLKITIESGLSKSDVL